MTVLGGRGGELDNDIVIIIWNLCHPIRYMVLDIKDGYGN